MPLASEKIEPFPVLHVAHVEPRPPERIWLVEHLLLREAAGLTGGASKACKTWFCGELALAVATGSKAFGRFAVHQQGSVLFYGAEDDPASLRVRFDAMARARSVALEDAPLYLLNVPQLRVDRAEDLARLRATIKAQQPVLVVLDPFVRIARVDELCAAAHN